MRSLIPAVANPAFALDLSPRARLLVVAAGGVGSEAEAAWRRWLAMREAGQQLVAVERTLLATVAWNLHSVVPNEELERALEQRRNVAASNLVAVARFQRVLTILEANDVPSVLLKGGALLSSACYGDLAARRMADLDVLVPFDCADDAVAALEAGGQTRFGGEVPLSTLRAVMHAAALQGPLGEVDLHWTLLHHSRSLAADRAVFDRARAATLGSVKVEVPDPTHLAFHLLAHGRLPDLRWLVDAHHVLRRGDVDSAYLAELAQERLYLRIVTENVNKLVGVLPGEATYALRDSLMRKRPHRGDALHTEYSSHTARAPRAASFVRFAFRQLSDRPGAEKFSFIRELTCFATGSERLPEALRRMSGYAAFNRHRPQPVKSAR